MSSPSPHQLTLREDTYPPTTREDTWSFKDPLHFMPATASIPCRPPSCPRFPNPQWLECQLVIFLIYLTSRNHLSCFLRLSWTLNLNNNYPYGNFIMVTELDKIEGVESLEISKGLYFLEETEMHHTDPRKKENSRL